MSGKNIGALLLVAVLVALGPANSWAALVYDSISGQTSSFSTELVYSTDLLAQQFTTSADHLHLDSVTLFMDQVSGYPGTAVVSIYSDNGANAPGVLVANGLLSDPVTYPTTLSPVVFSASNLLLSGLTRYWVVFQAQNSGRFEWSETQATTGYTGFGPWTGDPPFYYINTTNDGKITDSFDSPFEMAINASNPPTVPEPSTYVLLGIALGVVGFARMKINRSQW